MVVGIKERPLLRSMACASDNVNNLDRLITVFPKGGSCCLSPACGGIRGTRRLNAPTNRVRVRV